jgi:hypothetical protein
VLVVSGWIFGGVGAWYLSAAARTFLFSIEATDPRAFAAAFPLLAPRDWWPARFPRVAPPASIRW